MKIESRSGSGWRVVVGSLVAKNATGSISIAGNRIPGVHDYRTAVVRYMTIPNSGPLCRAHFGSAYCRKHYGTSTVSTTQHSTIVHG